MKTVDQMIAALEAFKAEHGGDRQVVKPDHYGNYHFMEMNSFLGPDVVIESGRAGYFDLDDDEDPNAVPVFVVD